MKIEPKFNTNDPEAVEIRRKVAAIGMELYDVTTLDVVRQFEEEAGIKLPADYVWFITNVGNGGTWHTESKYPFLPLTTAKEAIFADPYLYHVKDEHEKLSLSVLHRGCTYFFGIILYGEYYGEISQNNDGQICFTPNENTVHNFKELYTAWLDDAYLGYDEFGFERRHRGTVEELFRQYRRSGDIAYLNSVCSKINKKTVTKELTSKLRMEFTCEKDNTKKVTLCDILIKTGYKDPFSLIVKIFRPENYDRIIGYIHRPLKYFKDWMNAEGVMDGAEIYYPMLVEMLKYFNSRTQFDTFYFDRCLIMVIKNPRYNEADIIDVLTTDNKLAVDRISYFRWTPPVREIIGKYIALAIEKSEKSEKAEKHD